MYKLSRIVACNILVLSLGVAMQARATNFFSWGVESDSTSVPGQSVLRYDGNTSRSQTTAHTGQYSLKYVVQGNDGGNNQMGADLSPRISLPYEVVGEPAIYYRWWMKIMPGFSWGNGTAKTKASRVNGATYPRVYTGYVWANGFQLNECEDVGSAQPGGGCPSQGIHINYDMRSMNDGAWHEYIVMVKPNSTTSSSDAQFKVWVDGDLVGQQTNFMLHNKNNNGHGESWAGWMVRPYFQLNGTASDGGVIYVDDFSTDDTWNSSSTGAALPLPPSGIH